MEARDEVSTEEEEPREIRETFRNSHEDLITHVALDITGKRLATCSTDKILAIWNRDEAGKWYRVAKWKCHTGAVLRCVWAHPEFGQVLATCSCDRAVHIWEAVLLKSSDGKPKRLPKWIRRAYLTDSRNAVTDIVFAPRHLGLQLAAVSVQGFLRIYEAPDIMDLTRWTLHHELKAFHWRCSSVAWSPSSIHRPLLVVGSDELKDPRNRPDDRIVIYELNESYRKFQRITALKQELPSAVTDIQFNPICQGNHHQIAIAAGDIFIFNFKVPACSFMDDDGERGTPPAVSLNEYQSVRVAQLGMGDIKKAWRIRFNLTGNVLVASSGDGAVRVFKSLFANQWVQLTNVSSESYLADNPELPEAANYSRGKPLVLARPLM